MARRKTTEEYRRDLAAYTDKIICLDEYVNFKTKIQHQCRVCGHQWFVSPDSIFYGYGCPKCAGNLRKTTEEYKNELASVTDKIICLDEYVNNKTKIRHRCTVCGHEWFVMPDGILQGHGCPKCSNRALKTTEEYRKELAAITDTIICLGEYENAKTRKFTIYDDYRSGNSSREKYLQNLKQIQERLAEIDTLIPGLEQQIKEADKKMEGVNETENHLADIAALQSYDKETLS